MQRASGSADWPAGRRSCCASADERKCDLNLNWLEYRCIEVNKSIISDCDNMMSEFGQTCDMTADPKGSRKQRRPQRIEGTYK